MEPKPLFSSSLFFISFFFFLVLNCVSLFSRLLAPQSNASCAGINTVATCADDRSRSLHAVPFDLLQLFF